jgi:hypothetical protein
VSDLGIIAPRAAPDDAPPAPAAGRPPVLARGTAPELRPVAAEFTFVGYTPPPPVTPAPAPTPPPKARRRRRRHRLRGQADLPLPKPPRRLVLRDNLRPLLARELPALPATRGDCTGASDPRVGGICPKFSCRHNLALWVKANGAFKVEGTAGDTRRQTIRSHRRVSDATLERVADAIIARADRLGISLCSLDLADAIAAERVRLRTMKKDAADEPDWTFALIANIMGVSAERARVLGRDAERGLRVRLRAAGLAPDDDGGDAGGDDGDGDDELALLVPTPPAPAPRASTAPLVQIRRRTKL